MIVCRIPYKRIDERCYPIVKSSHLNPLYKDLPVVIVKDWKEVTESFLEKKHKEFKSQTWSRDKLYAPFWFQKIKDCTERSAAVLF